jgi:ABC-type Mn2+/Zn2+ transport system permease subunit
MFKLLLISIVIAPVLLAMQAATRRRGRAGLSLLLALVFSYDALYWLLLYYLRVRWVDWGSG